MLVRLLRTYLVPYRTLLAAVIVLQLFGTLAALYLPSLNADIIDNGVAKADTGYILRTGTMMLAVTLVQVVCSVAAVYFGARTAMGFGRDTRAAVFHQVGAFSSREVTRFGAPSLITRTTNDVQQVQIVVLLTCTLMISAPIMCVGGIIMALRQDLGLSWLIVVSVTILVAAIAMIISRMVPQFRLMQTRIDVVNRVLREQISGIRVVRAFVREPVERQRFGAANIALTDTALRVGRLQAFLFPIVLLVLNVSSVAVLWFGAHRIQDGEMQIGSLTAFLSYLLQILMSIMMATFMLILVPRAAVSADRLMEVLDTESSVIPPSDPVTELALHATLELEGVTFTYPGADDPVLRNISVRTGPGQTTAIIGSTGSGKSTLVSLIPRLMDATGGQGARRRCRRTPARPGPAARAHRPRPPDGLPVHRHDREQPALWQGGRHRRGAVAGPARRRRPTTSSRPWRRGSTLRLRRAARTSRAGSGSAWRSRGPSCTEPEIYLFDDSFSALDLATDARLRAALRPITRDSAVVIVAQRVSTIVDADQILVIDDGAVMGLGTHDELLAGCPTYAEIVESQLPAEAVA